MMTLIFFYNEPATPEIYPLSLHDALPISRARHHGRAPRDAHAPERAHGGHGGDGRLSHREGRVRELARPARHRARSGADRKSTRLNSSHLVISYAVFCLKKTQTTMRQPRH